VYLVLYGFHEALGWFPLRVRDDKSSAWAARHLLADGRGGAYHVLVELGFSQRKCWFILL